MILQLQHTIGNQAVQRLLQRKPAFKRLTAQAIQRQPKPGAGASGSAHTITDPEAIIRDGPPKFKPTGAKPLPVGTRVDVLDTQSLGKQTFVNVAEHGTGNVLGWTSNQNLGDVQYAKAAASFVYTAKMKPRKGHADMLPVMVYVPPKFDGKNADVVLYFHGDAANYTASTSDNYDSENPALGMNLPGVAAGGKKLIIAPQGNEWATGNQYRKSPWDTLQPGDYETIVQTALTNLQDDLKLPAISRGSFSIAGHSGGGKALGQAAQDLDKSGSGVTDVTLVEAGYGGGEDAKGNADGSFAKSFQLVREWLLTGKREKVLRIMTKASSTGSDTRHAFENTAAENKAGDRIAVLGVEGVTNAIKAKGLDSKLHADATEVKDTVKRSGGMQLTRKIVVSHTAGGKPQGTIYVFFMADPPRGKGVDTHFGVRDATITDIASGGGTGDDFAKQP